MSELTKQLQSMNLDPSRGPQEVNGEIATLLEEYGYTIAIQDSGKPWGGFNQLVNTDADAFLDEFFPGLSPEDARLGNPMSELSPKILAVAPEQRLSWQYHDRRAERWAYLTTGGYFKSLNNNQGVLQHAEAGEVVQFAKSERHRLVGAMGHYTLVAEIWQHTNPEHLSDEADIVRLADDYKR
jgi:mannose-6-phosphate isomerase